jgi:Dna[CI] antecedent, DciA
MERIGESVGKELARSGGGAGATLGDISAVWPAAVGDAVSRQAWPLRVSRDGTLHVATASSTWAFELDRLSPEIGERLATLLGASAPAKLQFRVGPIPEPAGLAGDASGHSHDPPETTPETVSEAATIASEIEDPELRELVARAALGSLARARSGRQI